MVRLRRLGSEFYSPDDIAESVQMHMPYLEDFEAFQKYMDGDLSPLIQRMRGPEKIQDLTGAALYDAAGDGSASNVYGAYYIMNLFRAGLRYITSAVFEKNPTALDCDDDGPEMKAWEEIRAMLLKEGRKAVEWYFAKGHGVFHLEKRVGNKMMLAAADPAGYLPIVDLINRDRTLGHILFYRYYTGPRTPQYDVPDRIRFYIYVDECGAEESDGRLRMTNDVVDMAWAGEQGQGFASSQSPVMSGRLGQVSLREESARTVGIWAFGSGDSVFKTMERTVYECILSLSHGRSALTQDIRSTRVVPQNAEGIGRGEDGKILLDRIRPEYQISLNSVTGADLLGYLDPPGPAMSEAFREQYNLQLTNLAYDANMPPEAFGLNYTSGEPAEAITKLQQIFKTYVIDIRDDLSAIYTDVVKAMTGLDIKIGWEDEPFASTEVYRQGIRNDYRDGIINLEYTQERLGYPVMEVMPPGGMNNATPERQRGQEGADLDGRDDRQPQGTQDGPDPDGQPQ